MTRMHPSSMLGLLVLVATAIACGNDDSNGNPFDSNSMGPTTTGTSTTPTSTPMDSDDADSTASTGGGQSVELGPCERVAGCIEALDEAITPFLAAYGPEGTCWEEFTVEQCWQDCRALLDGFAPNCAETEACCECVTLEDCAYDASFESCDDNQCAGAPVPMYSTCTSDADCVGLDYCFLFGDVGYCTNLCQDVSECEPTPPGGTATPACANIDEDNGGLECGLLCDVVPDTCPPGMSCGEFLEFGFETYCLAEGS
jgi:hypothetical protein